MNAAPRFADLAPRLASGGVMAALGIAGVWAGGLIFAVMVAALCGAMMWELMRMLHPAPPGHALGEGVGAALSLLLVTTFLDPPAALAVMPVLAVALTWHGPQHRPVRTGYAAVILLAGLGLIVLRDSYGWEWVLWLVLVVIGSDVAGYFAGRLIGGPKLWPRVSPKKTWSGTVAGWAVALGIGAAMLGPLGAGPGLLVASVLLCMAGQAGDIAESAVKRMVGVKDSSTLIPGHGGALDRFDAMIAAALMALLLAAAGVLD